MTRNNAFKISDGAEVVKLEVEEEAKNLSISYDLSVSDVEESDSEARCWLSNNEPGGKKKKKLPSRRTFITWMCASGLLLAAGLASVVMTIVVVLPGRGLLLLAGGTTSTITATTSTSTTATSSSTATATSSSTVSTTSQGFVLYCWVLARHGKGELELMSIQLDRSLGIFDCDKYAVFSNARRQIGHTASAYTEVIEGSLEAPLGGLYNMSLNTDIFLKAWRHIFRDKVYLRYAWTVKVDPDAVFFASRLRSRVARVQDLAGDEHGVYLNNCRIGNHGPIEVISHRGMVVLSEGLGTCTDENVAPTEESGEDVFARRCLRRLGVKARDDFELLSEINCFENPTPCISGKAVFHPFKSERPFLQCVAEATGDYSPPLQRPTCKIFGCSKDYVSGIPCQCNDQCGSFGNCCEDYEDRCVVQQIASM